MSDGKRMELEKEIKKKDHLLRLTSGTLNKIIKYGFNGTRYNALRSVDEREVIHLIELIEPNEIENA